MTENMIEKLRAKGWSPDEIAQALRVMTEAQNEKTEVVRYMDRVVYWTLLFFVLIGNFILSIITIPFIVFAPAVFLFPMVFVISFTFGALYDLVLYDINKIEGAKQFLPQILLPALALINSYISLNLAHTLADKIGVVQIPSTDTFMPIIYVIGFMAPFWYTQRTNFWEKALSKQSAK